MKNVKGIGPSHLTDLSAVSLDEEKTWGLEQVEGTGPTNLSGEFSTLLRIRVALKLDCLY